MSTTPPPPQAPPPPPADGPVNALAVGKVFVRQYYKILQSSPANIRNFYHPDSTILHVGTGGGAEGDDSKSHLFADLPDDAFAWASPIKAEAEESEPTDVLAIDFSAAESRIDAQNSVNGGILLVACGHMHLPGSEGSGVPDRPFIHTFVLACSAPTAPGRKKQYYVHNDILRVMKAEKRSAASTGATSTSTAAESQEATTTSTSATEAEAKPKATPTLVEEAAANTEEKEAPAPAPQAAEEVPADDGAANSKTSTPAEVTKEAPAALAQDPSANSASTESTPKSADKKGSKSRRGRGSRGNSRSASPTNANSSKGAITEEDLKAAAEAAAAAVSAPKVPESWASRVKIGGPPSVPPSPARDAAASKKGKKQGGGKDDENTKNGGAPSDDRGSSKDAKSSGKRPPAAPRGGTNSEPPGRNPDATLIVRNIPNKTSNADIHALFDPYADRHRCPVRVVSVLQNRNIAYVDFDHPEGVAAILRDSVGQDTWKLHGNVLEVKRKSDDKRSGGGGQGGGGGGGGGGNRNRHRSASPGTGHQKSGGGGGKNFRKPSPRHQRPGGGGGGGGGSRGGGGK